jgi:hypothetical protein
VGLTRETALDVLHKCGFHLYHAKSWNESLFIHSFSTYALVDGMLPFTHVYSESDKELMRWAALLHDYGKTSANWQKALRGPHRVSLADVTYDELKATLANGIQRCSSGLLTPADIDDVLFIIEHHHGSGRLASTPARNRMKDVVSECDRAVSQTRISEGLVRTLNSIVDTVRYRLFTVELIDHPMSALVVGAFDYVFADGLRAAGVPLVEWTGIQKTCNDDASLVVATSAAEVGRDLPFREVHTEFWGNNWEVSSVIQRIGRVGRSREARRSRAHIWITGREPGILPSLLEGRGTLTKAEFGELLVKAFGEPASRPEDYVSCYLWDQAKTRVLRRFWQIPPDVRKLRFHFRPPNAQAVFDWRDIRFAYDWVPIANRYQLEKVAEVTDLPFWHEMGYSEWRVGAPLEKRQYLQRYDGKRDQTHRRWFW